MADSAASPSSRFPRSSPVKGRSRAASSDDDRRPSRVAIEPQMQVGRDIDAEPTDSAQAPHVDPRQGTLLGFELPVEALAAATSESGQADAEGTVWTAPGGTNEERPAAATHSEAVAGPVVENPPVVSETQGIAAKSAAGKRTGGDMTAAEVSVAREAAVTSPKAAAPQQAVRSQSAQRRKPAAAGNAESAALPDAPEPQLLSPGAALASVRQQGVRRPAEAARSSGSTAGTAMEAADTAALAGAAPAASDAQSRGTRPSAAPAAVTTATGADRSSDDAGRTSVSARMPGSGPESERSEPAALAATVASMQEALAQARRAAEERWRRMRHWLALALAALALLLGVAIAQTVALIGFAHRTEAAQQQAAAAMSGQQAALANLASATSALAAKVGAPERQAPAADAAGPANAAPPPAKHAKPAHARRHAASSRPPHASPALEQ